MTNQENIRQIASCDAAKAADYFNDVFGCPPFEDLLNISEICQSQRNCLVCWKHWLESEVSTNDHA